MKFKKILGITVLAVASTVAWLLVVPVVTNLLKMIKH